MTKITECITKITMREFYEDTQQPIKALFNNYISKQIPDIKLFY